MKDGTSIVQIVVALIGFISAVAVEVVRRLPSGPKVNEGARGASTVSASPPPPQSRSPLELAIVLLCSAFFSALLVDSLLVSGKNPNPDAVVLGNILLITGLTTLALVLSWWWRKSEIGIGIATVTTYLVLLLALGGPFAPRSGDSVSGVQLYVPIFVLTVMISAVTIYRFGNPLERRTRRIWSASVLATLILFGSGILGWQLLSDTEQDHLSPHDPDPAPTAYRDAFDKLRSKDLATRGLFYRLGSELALVDRYREVYYQTVDFLADRSGAQAPTGRAVTAGAASPPRTEAELKRRHGLLEELSRQVQAIPDEQKLDYLADRLSRTHPTVAGGKVPLPLPLPGLGAVERYTATSELRALHALLYWSNAEFTVDEPFDYSPPLKSAFGKLTSPDKRTTVKPTFELDAYIQMDEATRRVLFPDLADKRYSETLGFHLALPKAEDAYMAFATYQSIAVMEEKADSEGSPAPVAPAPLEPIPQGAR